VSQVVMVNFMNFFSLKFKNFTVGCEKFF